MLQLAVVGRFIIKHLKWLNSKEFRVYYLFYLAFFMLFIESRSSATKTSKRCIVFYILVHKPNSCLNNFPDMSPRNDVNVIKIAVISSLSDFPFLVVYARFWLEIYSVTCFYMHINVWECDKKNSCANDNQRIYVSKKSNLYKTSNIQQPMMISW